MTLTRDQHYLQKYGLSEQELAERLERDQDGKCEICRAVIVLGRTAVVDHDHESKRKVRGILCHRCNQGLGHFNDDPRMVRDALRYLVDSLSEAKLEKYNYWAKEVYGDEPWG